MEAFGATFSTIFSVDEDKEELCNVFVGEQDMGGKFVPSTFEIKQIEEVILGLMVRLAPPHAGLLHIN